MNRIHSSFLPPSRGLDSHIEYNIFAQPHPFRSFVRTTSSSSLLTSFTSLVIEKKQEERERRHIAYDVTDSQSID